MKRLTKILSSVSVSLFLSLSGLLGLGVAHAAGSASLSLSPASGTETQNTTFSVDVYVNSATPVTAVQADVTYPTSLLTYVGYTSSPNFPLATQNPGATDSSGTLTFVHGTTTPTTGNQLLVTIQFTPKAGSGTATLGFDGNSTVIANDNSTDSLITNGANYSLISAGGGSGGGSSGGSSSGGSSSSSSSGSSSGSSSSSSKSSGSSSTSSPKSSTIPAATSTATISNISVTNLSANSATVSWKTSAPTTSEVDYGLTSDYGVAAADTSLVTQHKLTLDPKTLIKASTYHFVVRGLDANSQSVASQDMTFRTTGGVNLTVKVVDQNNKAVKGAAVTISGVTTITDGSGRATLSDLPTGEVKITIINNGATTNTTLKLSSEQNQSDIIKIHVAPSKTGWILPIVIIAVLVIIAVSAQMLMLKHRDASAEMSRHFPKLPGNGGPTSGSSGGPSNIIAPSGGSSPSVTASNASANPGNVIKPNKQP